MLLASGTMDGIIRDKIKRKMLDNLPKDEKLTNSMIPNIVQNLAVSELLNANQFYKEVQDPINLLFLKGIMRIRPFKYETSKNHLVYKDIIDKSLKNPVILTEHNLLNLMNSICMIELKKEAYEL